MLTLQANDLSKDYHTGRTTVTVLRGVSLALAGGESAAILGPSGCGKSTLLNILGTLETPTSGSVRIGDRNPFELTEPELARFRNRTVGFVFQDHHLLPHCSVLENVLIPTLAGECRNEHVERAKALIDRVGLSERLEHRPAELSGGERQRVAVARAMINRPAVVLADEPTGNLDHRSAETVADLLLELHRVERTILLVVTHSQALASRFARRYGLDDGLLAPIGPA